MNSGPTWSPRNGAQYRRLCARAGCGAPAVATLRFQSTERQAWLGEIDDNAARTQGDLCGRHAAALVLPRGWELHDERAGSSTPAPDAPPAGDERGQKRGSGNGTRRVRVRRTERGSQARPEAAQLPGIDPEGAATDPVVPEVAVEEVAVDAEVEVEEREVEVAVEVEAREAGNDLVNDTRHGPLGANDDGEIGDALDAVLDARTPLLRRAFRNSRSQ